MPLIFVSVVILQYIQLSKRLPLFFVHFYDNITFATNFDIWEFLTRVIIPKLVFAFEMNLTNLLPWFSLKRSSPFCRLFLFIQMISELVHNIIIPCGTMQKLTVFVGKLVSKYVPHLLHFSMLKQDKESATIGHCRYFRRRCSRNLRTSGKPALALSETGL